MKYKPGDKVRIKSLDWYNENKDEDGRVMCGYTGFCKEMKSYCGKELTIDFIYDSDGKSVYVMKEPKINWGFTDEMIEGLANVVPQERMVSLDKVCDVLYDMLHNQWINDGAMVGTWAYENMVEFIKDFCKRLEE